MNRAPTAWLTIDIAGIGRETGHPVRAVLLDGVHVRRGGDLSCLPPLGAHEPALAAGRLVAPGLHRVVHDVRPRQHRVLQSLLRLAVVLQQNAANIRIAHARRRIRVPGERGSSGAPARLVLGLVGADRRVVGLLRLPGDHAVLDVDLPRTRSGAVDAVCRADHLVVRPAVPVEVVRGPAADLVQGPLVLGDLAAMKVFAESEQGVGCRLAT